MRPHPEQPHNYQRTGGVLTIMGTAIIPWFRVRTYVQTYSKGANKRDDPNKRDDLTEIILLP